MLCKWVTRRIYEGKTCLNCYGQGSLFLVKVKGIAKLELEEGCDIPIYKGDDYDNHTI